jgi:hypothetical protein
LAIPKSRISSISSKIDLFFKTISSLSDTIPTLFLNYLLMDTVHRDLEEDQGLHLLIEETRKIYERQKSIYSPYFEELITCTSDGFNHLLFKTSRLPRSVAEQNLKLRLLKKGIGILKRARTLQEYRVQYEKVGKQDRNGFTKTRRVEYWAFHDIVGDKNRFLMRVIVRKVGNGQIHFWSVMPHGKINSQKLYEAGIEDV